MGYSKQGFSFYTIDTDRYQNRRIKRLKKDFGCNGIAVYDYLLCEIYRVRGCGSVWDEDTAFDVAEYFGLKENLVKEIVKYCGVVGLFNKELLSRGILTSEAIQRRYLEMCSRAKRKDAIIPEEWRIITEESAKIQEECQKTPEVCAKVKYSKVNNINSLSFSPSYEPSESENNGGITDAERDVFYEIFYFKNFLNPQQEVERFINHYAANGWRRGKMDRPVADRIALARCWEQEQRGANPRINPTFLGQWQSLYLHLKGKDKESAKILLGLQSVLITDNAICIITDRELYQMVTSQPDVFRKGLFDIHYPSKKPSVKLA